MRYQIRQNGHLNVTFTAHIYNVCLQVRHVRSPCAVHMPTVRHIIALIAASMWDVPCVYATCTGDTQWSGSHTRHHRQWHRHSCAICAACASPMRHWYAVDRQHMWNSSAGDVPPNHLGDLTAYLFIFSYAVRAPWHRRPVEQGHKAQWIGHMMLWQTELSVMLL